MAGPTQYEHGIVGRHCDDLIECQPVLAGMRVDIGNVSNAPFGIRFSQLLIKLPIAVGHPVAMPSERPIDSQGASGLQQVRRTLEQMFGDGKRCDVQNVAGKDQIEPTVDGDRPFSVHQVDANGRFKIARCRRRTMGGDTRERARVEVARLPIHGRKGTRKGDRVLAGSAGQFQRAPAARDRGNKMRQRLDDRRLVAVGGRREPALIAVADIRPEPWLRGFGAHGAGDSTTGAIGPDKGGVARLK